jgi:arylsulfatase A-like enzyme
MQTPPTQPNILFILIDDMGWRDLTCQGSPFYETPNIDRIASGGMRFTDAYASCPVCSPTRASVLTGKYPARVGITNYIAGNAWGKLMGVPYFHELPKSETTIATALREGGYSTYHVGKWHLGPREHWPEHFGFDVNIGGCDRGAPSSYFSPYKNPTLSDGPDGEYLTDRLTDEALALISEHGPDGDSRNKPFFMYMSHYTVHTPLQAPADLVRKYEEKARRMGLDPEQALEPGDFFPCLHKKEQRIMRRKFQSHPVYAAMIENLDTNVGRMLDSLEQHGLAENTIVIFTSDNGGLSSAEGSPTTNAPLCEGKGWMYDGGVREPLLVCWPGRIGAGTTCDVPVTSTDFYPTFLEAASLPLRPQQHADGESILPLLTASGSLQREAIFWHYPHYSNQGGTPACSIRAGDWKLIEFFEDYRLELYNLREDISEANNLAGVEPEIVRDLHQKLVAWRESIEAKIPEPNPHYDDMLAGRRPCPNGAGIIPGDDH